MDLILKFLSSLFPDVSSLWCNLKIILSILWRKSLPDGNLYICILIPRCIKQVLGWDKCLALYKFWSWVVSKSKTMKACRKGYADRGSRACMDKHINLHGKTTHSLYIHCIRPLLPGVSLLLDSLMLVIALLKWDHGLACSSVPHLWAW